ncbi:hypothetical protein [Corynebacterium pacaense]|uniref:Rv1157c family protein n=1 Tax=Corynebacterium pacaense TaxID=1816684 RepID=UPI001FEC0B89|nr:hypothetical protein [Corynebacterium pacaense]
MLKAQAGHIQGPRRRFSLRFLAAAVVLGTAASTAVPASASPVDDAYAFSQNLSSGLPVDQWGRPNQQVRDQIAALAAQPWVPAEVRGIIAQALGFLDGGGEPGVEIPKGAPRIAQFAWPTRAENCIAGDSASIGSAFAVPGPADLPLPGAGPGQTSFVFTALGTGPLAAEQQSKMQVQWANLSTLTHGSTVLGNTGINPEGPSTLSGVADTGSGVIVAVLTGGLSTAVQDAPVTCNFAPTAVIFDVR